MKHLQRPNKTYPLLYLSVAGLLLLSAVTGLLLGATALTPAEIWDALMGKDSASAAARIFWNVRLPRVLATLFCGAALAVSGAVLQGALANRLASPSIIGVNAGAGLAVTLAAALGMLGGWRVALFAFFGAFLATLLISLGAKKWGLSRGTVILAGVALNSLLGALSDCVVTFSAQAGMIRNEFRVGDFSSVSFASLNPATVAILLSLLLLFTLSNDLDVLSLGDENARGLGLHTERTRTVMLLLSAVLAGAAVSIAGQLSFVGLLIPHALRRLGVTRSVHLLPLSALLGAGFVTLCDTLSRTLFSPYELPVGILLALVGTPFFLILLIRKKGGHRHD